MKTKIILAALLTATMVTPALAMEHYMAKLTGDQESKPTGSAATGEGMAMLADNGKELSIMLKWSDLSAKASAGHIHCCAAPGADAGVAIMLKPDETTSGNLSNKVDLNKAATYTATFLAANGGTAAGAKAALVKAMGSNNAYFNIHTANHPGGEIRGNISGDKM
jgi:hypothetical protein